MTRENWIAIVAMFITIAGYGVQDLRRQTAVETKLEALVTWQVEHQKTESLMAITNQKVDTLTFTVEKLANNMEKFLEELYLIKLGVAQEVKNGKR